MYSNSNNKENNSMNLSDESEKLIGCDKCNSWTRMYIENSEQKPIEDKGYICGFCTSEFMSRMISKCKEKDALIHKLQQGAKEDELNKTNMLNIIQKSKEEIDILKIEQ